MHKCHGTCAEIRGQLLEVSSTLRCRVQEIEPRLSDLAAVNFTEHATALGPGAAFVDTMARKSKNSYPISQVITECQVKVSLGVAVNKRG